MPRYTSSEAFTQSIIKENRRAFTHPDRPAAIAQQIQQQGSVRLPYLPIHPRTVVFETRRWHNRTGLVRVAVSATGANSNRRRKTRKILPCGRCKIFLYTPGGHEDRLMLRNNDGRNTKPKPKGNAFLSRLSTALCSASPYVHVYSS